MLRARPPEPTEKRLKLFMFGPAGVGKTTAAIQFPQSYIIDCERGTENYDKLIKGSGSAVFQTTQIKEVIEEVRSLLKEKHDFRTLVIDPITPAYDDLLQLCEKKVGEAHGRHYGEANKEMKRLANLILALDMNVVVTAHAKVEYGANQQKLGYTFDGWRRLDYWFDLVVELEKRSKKRFARIAKSRLHGFPDEDSFEWSYQVIKERCAPGMLEKEARVITLATPEQIMEIKELLLVVRLPEGTTDRWFAKANADCWEDMPSEVIAKCIEYVNNRRPQGIASGERRVVPV